MLDAFILQISDPDFLLGVSAGVLFALLVVIALLGISTRRPRPPLPPPEQPRPGYDRRRIRPYRSDCFPKDFNHDGDS